MNAQQINRLLLGLVLISFVYSCSAGGSSGPVTPDVKVSVLQLQPGDGSVGISATQDIAVRFSELVDSSSINGSSLAVFRGANQLAGTVQADQNTLRFVPAAGALPLASTIRASLSEDIRFQNGARLGAAQDWRFDTEDLSLPQVVSTNPITGLQNTPALQPVSALFSRDMDAATFNSSTFFVEWVSGNTNPAGCAQNTCGTNSQVCGTVQYANRRVTFTPNVGACTQSVYRATIRGSVRDSRGLALGSDYVWSFVAGDTVLPTVTTSLPFDGAIDQSLTTNSAVVNFSEPLAPETVSNSSITVQDEFGNVIPANVNYTQAPPNISRATLTFQNISTGLIPKTEYRILVRTGITDLSNNPLDRNYTLRFRTVDTVSAASQIENSTVGCSDPRIVFDAFRRGFQVAWRVGSTGINGNFVSPYHVNATLEGVIKQDTQGFTATRDTFSLVSANDTMLVVWNSNVLETIPNYALTSPQSRHKMYANQLNNDQNSWDPSRFQRIGGYFPMSLTTPNGEQLSNGLVGDANDAGTVAVSPNGVAYATWMMTYSNPINTTNGTGSIPTYVGMVMTSRFDGGWSAQEPVHAKVFQTGTTTDNFGNYPQMSFGLDGRLYCPWWEQQLPNGGTGTNRFNVNYRIPSDSAWQQSRISTSTFASTSPARCPLSTVLPDNTLMMIMDKKVGAISQMVAQPWTTAGQWGTQVTLGYELTPNENPPRECKSQQLIQFPDGQVFTAFQQKINGATGNFAIVVRHMNADMSWDPIPSATDPDIFPGGVGARMALTQEAANVQMAKTPNSGLILVWQQKINTTAGAASTAFSIIARRRNSMGVWEAPFIIRDKASTTTDALNPQVAVDPNSGVINIVWQESTGTLVHIFSSKLR